MPLPRDDEFIMTANARATAAGMADPYYPAGRQEGTPRSLLNFA